MNHIKTFKIFENTSSIDFKSLVDDVKDILSDLSDFDLYTRLDMGCIPGSSTSNLLEDGGIDTNVVGIKLMNLNLPNINIPFCLWIQSDGGFDFSNIKSSIEHLINYMESNGFKCQLRLGNKDKQSIVTLDNINTFDDIHIDFERGGEYYLNYHDNNHDVHSKGITFMILKKKYYYRSEMNMFPNPRVSECVSYDEVKSYLSNVISFFPGDIRKLTSGIKDEYVHTKNPDVGDYDRFFYKEMRGYLLLMDYRGELEFKIKTSDVVLGDVCVTISSEV